MVVVHLPEYSGFRVEEVERVSSLTQLLVCVVVECVAWSVHLVVYMAVLQVNVCTESLYELIVYLSVNIAVGLFGVVVIIICG